MTPTEALEYGAEYVERLSQKTWSAGSPPERTAAALDVARFLMAWEGETDEDEEEADEEDGPADLSERIPLGPARRVLSEFAPGDVAYVRAGKSGRRHFIVLGLGVDGEEHSLALPTVAGRAYAVGILDACDEADGASPLLEDIFRPKATE